jgi:hypothetical protein
MIVYEICEAGAIPNCKTAKQRLIMNPLVASNDTFTANRRKCKGMIVSMAHPYMMTIL